MRTHEKNRTTFALACLCVLGLTAFLGSSAPSVGAAETFPGQGFLPHNRAWEMVSPPDKNGGNVAPITWQVHSAADGERISFVSTVGFGDVQGSPTRTDYMSQRDGRPGTNGWATHAITPQQTPFTLENGIGANQLPGPGYQGDLSEDLSRGVFLSVRPLAGTPDAPNAAPVPNFYLRTDLRSPGAGSYRLLTDSVQPPPNLSSFELTIFGTPSLAGASADFEHVIFESRLALTEGTSFGEYRLYENDAGTVRLVGRVPAEPATFCEDGGDPSLQCTIAPSSQAGLSAFFERYSSQMISADGSRIFFQTPLNFEGGKIYLREDGVRTFQLNASEKETPEAPQDARLWDASRDGSRAFFITAEGLVEGDDDSNRDLYMYEVEKPEGERLTLVSVDREPSDDVSEVTTVESMVGASADGHYVYFTSEGQLVAGEPHFVVGHGLYAWHDGEISYLGRFDSANDASYNTPQASWFEYFTSKTSRISPDGRRLLFMSQSDEGFKGIGGFAGYDHGTGDCPVSITSVEGPCRELYLYDAESGKLRCASCNPSGAPATAVALTEVRADPGFIKARQHLSQALSDDGRYVFFSSAERLVPEDSNGTWDAYVYDATTERQHLLSSGEARRGSYFMDASNDGSDVFIATAEPLSRWDVDTSYDLYDARIDGGLPEPVPAPPACQGDACQPAPTRLNDQTPSSSSFRGAGNARRARCPRGKRRVKARSGKSRCVKRAKRNRANRRDAKHNRRAGR